MKPIILTCCCLLIFSCKKETPVGQQPIPTATNSGIYIANTTNKDVIFFWADTTWNPALNPNYKPQDSIYIPPGDTALLPYSRLAKPHTAGLYAWFTTDNTISNFHIVNSNAYVRDKFSFHTPISGADTLIVLSGTPRKELLIYDGFFSKTQWLVADAYDSTGVSVWSGLPASKKGIWIQMSSYMWAGFQVIRTGTKEDTLWQNAHCDATAPHTLIKDWGATLSSNLKPSIPLETNAVDTIFLKQFDDSLYYKMYRKP